MKYLQISTVMSFGSIGKIMRQNYDEKKAQGWECLIAYGRGNAVEEYNSIRIGNKWDIQFQGIETRLFDLHGYGSKKATRAFLKKMDAWGPDIVHLHNIHGYFLNFEIVFEWLKSHPERKTIWTLHDCWAFTGHCTYFTAAKCEQWKTHCLHCPQLRQYPACYLAGNVDRNFVRKKAAFTGVSNMQLVVPSRWLEGLVKQSYLQEYPVEVVYNTIDKKVFKPTPSDFRERYSLQGKKIVLGVANVWDTRKGLNDFISLAGLLDDGYVIVLVGLTERQIKKMPPNIIGLRRTNSAQELAAIYTAADVFVNPTYEDNYPTVNLEAQACGTPVITYDVGGCKETLHNSNCALTACGVENILKQLKRLEERARKCK